VISHHEFISIIYSNNRSGSNLIFWRYVSYMFIHLCLNFHVQKGCNYFFISHSPKCFSKTISIRSPSLVHPYYRHSIILEKINAISNQFSIIWYLKWCYTELIALIDIYISYESDFKNSFTVARYQRSRFCADSCTFVSE